MAFRNLIIDLTHALFKRDADALLDRACRLNESGKLSNKDWNAFADMAIRYRDWLLP